MKLETWSSTREPTEFLIKRGENPTFFKTRPWKSVFSKIKSEMISKPEIKKKKKMYSIFSIYFLNTEPDPPRFYHQYWNTLCIAF